MLVDVRIVFDCADGCLVAQKYVFAVKIVVSVQYENWWQSTIIQVRATELAELWWPVGKSAFL